MTKASNQYKKGLWTEEEDRILVEYIRVNGRRHWNRIPKVTGLMRNGKSCRLRWLNYLSPNVKHGSFSEEEDDLIIRLHNLLGNRWSLIAGRVPGRTDNQVKNHWNTHLCKKLGIRKQTGKVRVPSKPRASEMEEGTQKVHVSLDSRPKVPLNSDDKQKETETTKGHESCLNDSVATIDEGPYWPGGREEEHFDQTFLFSGDDYHKFVLDSPGLMEFFDGFDTI